MNKLPKNRVKRARPQRTATTTAAPAGYEWTYGSKVSDYRLSMISENRLARAKKQEEFKQEIRDLRDKRLELVRDVQSVSDVQLQLESKERELRELPPRTINPFGSRR